MLGNKHYRLKKNKTLISSNAYQTKCFAFLKGPDNFLEEILVYDPQLRWEKPKVKKPKEHWMENILAGSEYKSTGL